MYTVGHKKTYHWIFVQNFKKFWPIFKNSFNVVGLLGNKFATRLVIFPTAPALH